MSQKGLSSLALEIMQEQLTKVNKKKKPKPPNIGGNDDEDFTESFKALSKEEQKRLLGLVKKEKN